MSWWLHSSQTRAARFARRFYEDAKRPIVPAATKPDPSKWGSNAITLAWLGHSTVLINFFGFRILTDPALGSRVGVSLGLLGTAGIKRFVAPALTLKELPPIDLLLLSHAHMDHMDLATLRRFPKDVATVSAVDTSDLLLSAERKDIHELRWSENAKITTRQGELMVEAFEVKHWGQRWPSEKPRGYNGYILRREGKALIFGGDTALTPHFRELKPRGPFEAAIMPIGAYRPWIWNHCSPEEAWVMANAAGARYLLPVHHKTFKLSEEGMDEPIERLQTALRSEPERLAWRDIGQTFRI
jgi:L-ascorbate metabolism protein UlaG (beta-lactamase superfamily)